MPIANTIRKAPRRPQEARSRGGIGMGSDTVHQRLVGPRIRWCHRPLRSFGFVTGSAGVAVVRVSKVAGVGM